jgi:hypothetical protein
LQCPRCDVRLNFQEGDEPGVSPSAPGRWQHTPWGRILIGLILAQGIFHGLRHLCVAWFLASDSNAQAVLWGSLSGLVLFQSLQIVSLFFGALLAGAGQHQGAVYGAVLGIWNGVFLALVQPLETELMNGVTLYSLPVLHAALGALAGWVGGRIWRPLTPAVVPGASRAVLKTVTRQRNKWFVGPIHWPRVIMGTCVAVGGSLWAGLVLDLVKQASNYNLSPGSALQAQVITWEITALAILAGAALAGAATRNGVKQGVVVGLATSVILFGIHLASPRTPSFIILSITMFVPSILGILGGGFGSQLLPPLPPARRRSFETP